MNMKKFLGIGAAVFGAAVFGAVAGTATIINHNKNMRLRTATKPAAEPAATVKTANGVPITTIVPGRFLTMYEIAAQMIAGKEIPRWGYVSRHSDPTTLSAVTGEYKPDAVAIQATWQDPETQKVHLVLIKQYRAPVNDYVIELPAGLVDNGEVALSAALRETFEETGLNFVPDSDAKILLGFSSIGMTDECIGLTYGQCFGTPSSEHQEATENIEVILADLEMCQTILADAETHPCDTRAVFAMQLFINEHSEP